ncbi:hypothetical protein PV08_00242 [Exophiala spinifera]|uniref:NB-ARC domain-containing protein n=1 Tax=Exophiala spinifera TaxID=91928 RepID=A0A0D2BL31_9EURO|nr:uncharacterized protein PV08_00242 [Exophiala spinifera]KIW19668.1 hypothetical protein PV08_00242 [Exophiala spinifera]
MALPSFAVTFPDSLNHGSQIGVVQNSTIHNNTNNTITRPETPPSPSSFVPFPRDAHFVDRGTLLDEIHGSCFAKTSWTALVGFGGVGKSQLAIEYTYRLSEETPDIWIFWIHAGNATRFTQDFQEVADIVKIPERHTPDADICSLVHNWLRNKKNGKWLLVLDSLDNADFLFETHQESVRRSKPLIEYLPRTSHGSILITTRTKAVAVRFVEEQDAISVEPMIKKQALALLRLKLGKLGLQENDPDVESLARALEYMPLAIVQAAAYISQRAPRCTIGQYLKKFWKSDNGKEMLLSHEGGHLRRDRDAKNSIIATWQISFDHIKHIRPSSADLLSLMSFFDPQGIPESLLRNRAETSDECESMRTAGVDEEVEEGSSSVSMDMDEFEEDILTLRNYSFISLNMDKITFQMHSLVQLATRRWLERHGQFEKWNIQYIKNLNKYFPDGEYESWAKCRVLLPHVKAAMTQKPKTEATLLEWASLLCRAAWYCLEVENDTDAATMSTASMVERKKVLGDMHLDTLLSMGMMGLAYKRCGRWREAEELARQVMEARKLILGEDHPSVISSIHNLALSFMHQSRWQEAETLLRPLPEKLKDVWGSAHHVQLSIMVNLARAQMEQDKLQESEELSLFVVETMKELLGTEHPRTLDSIRLLAEVYFEQGRWKEAEFLFTECMGSEKRLYGANNRTTLKSMSGLASTYRLQGRLTQAEELSVQVMNTSLTVLGENHPDTLSFMEELARTYKDQGQLNKAEELQLQVVNARKKVLGTEHVGSLASINNLAVIYSNQEKHVEAEELQVQVFEKYKKLLGSEHPTTLTSMGSLAVTYCNQGRLKEAEPLQLQALETGKKVLGVEHPSTLDRMANLAIIYSKQGRLKEAEQLGLQAMETEKKVLGVEHPTTLKTMSKLAAIYSHQGQLEEAEKLDVEVMETSRRVLGLEHTFTWLSDISLAHTWIRLGRLQEAAELEEQVLETTRRLRRLDHPHALACMNNLAFTRKTQGRRDEAIKLMEECVQLRSQVLGPGHPHTLSSSAALTKWRMEDVSPADSTLPDVVEPAPTGASG